MRKNQWPLICLLPLLLSAAPASAADCDRACLTGFVDRYLTGLTKHDASSVPFASGVKFTENGTAKRPGEGLWQTVTKVVTRREVMADPVAGNAAFWGVLDEQGAPVMLSARLKIVDQKITELETIVARKGSHSLFVPDAFGSAPPAFGQPLEPAQRVSRERLIAAANGYFEGLEKHNDKLVPSAVECNRFENGQQMTNRGGTITPRACATAVNGLAHIKRVYNRRYDIADEERGVVFSTIMFDIPADTSATPAREGRMLLLSEVFKIVGGEITRIETVMHNLPYGSPSGWPDR